MANGGCDFSSVAKVKDVGLKVSTVLPFDRVAIVVIPFRSRVCSREVLPCVDAEFNESSDGISHAFISLLREADDDVGDRDGAARHADAYRVDVLLPGGSFPQVLKDCRIERLKAVDEMSTAAAIHPCQNVRSM